MLIHDHCTEQLLMWSWRFITMTDQYIHTGLLLASLLRLDYI